MFLCEESMHGLTVVAGVLIIRKINKENLNDPL